MRGPTPRRLHQYFCRRLGWYLADPGDGRTSPQIPATDLLWALILGKVLRVSAFHGLEHLVRLAGRGMGVSRSFGDDTLAYFTERLSAERARHALAALVKRAKRGKAFERSPHIALAIDGTGAGASAQPRCAWCHPHGKGCGHKLAAISVVGAGLDLPFDLEPYLPWENEIVAAKRLLPRAIHAIGRGFADVLVADGLYASAPFLHLCDELALPVLVRLKANLPELFEAAQARFRDRPPKKTFDYKGDRVEVWDADNFEPWSGLRWPSVRVLRYRHVRRDGQIFEAYWLTNLSARKVGSRALFDLCKSRWSGIENHGFNDAKNRYGLGHIPHHHPNSVLLHGLLTFLAMCLERLYRLRHLRRGTHQPPSAAQLVRILSLSLRRPVRYDTS